MSSLSPHSLLEPMPPPDTADHNTQVLDENNFPPSALAVERLFSHLSRSTQLLYAIRNFESAALDLQSTIQALGGGHARVELLQEHYAFIMGAPLRTFVLRVTGKTSGDVAEFVLPYDGSVLHSLPAKKFIQWVRAFERGEFGVPDAITPTQRELLVDFARIWEGFARLPRLDRGWEYFRLMMRWLATDAWVSNPAVEDGGFIQLSVLSEWAREQYPRWFEELEEDPDMPELVTVYSSDSDDEAIVNL
ncbi:hypothetical protein OH76DRAFT_1486510 [Lentinus brumalis]|uniref:Uncharacterized protein n=1 Tax=Lentinus brumalis TaxID=2498619 RepID=A0A371CY41_9APHY|nr:hypothetical protein OH76DRAFT_1486510 [Polyporus brumalis]